MLLTIYFPSTEFGYRLQELLNQIAPGETLEPDVIEVSSRSGFCCSSFLLFMHFFKAQALPPTGQSLRPETNPLRAPSRRIVFLAVYSRTY